MVANSWADERPGHDHEWSSSARSRKRFNLLGQGVTFGSRGLSHGLEKAKRGKGLVSLQSVEEFLAGPLLSCFARRLHD